MDEFKDCEIKRMELKDLKPAEYNPRKISDKALDGLGRSIEHFGLMIPVIWNKRSGNIVGGHQRYRHLVESGERETDVVVVDLDDNDEVALNITLNNPEIRGKFTDEALGILKTTEAKVGSIFNDIGLTNLHDLLAKGAKKKEPSDSGKSDNSQVSSDPPEPPSDKSDDIDLNQPDAIITCPECSSRWKMKDNEVIHNTVEGSQ